MQASILRSAPFKGTTSMRPAPVSRTSSVAVFAVQDVKGVIVSSKSAQTVVVNVERLAPHPKYFKRIRSSKRYVAHVEEGMNLSLGDYVRLEGTRPLSAMKRFKVAEVIRAADK